ncbi:MAG: hypothetical protein J0H74_36595 [Chitinophagaceae bacterium]|nr:hypothetical protein [Chitinophagaceae bacterium]
MSIEQQNTIDVIGIDKKTNQVILTISDHLDWQENNHLIILQEKLNTYLRFIESGEINESYPDAKNKSVVIKIRALHKPNSEAKSFLEKVKNIIEDAGMSFIFEHSAMR